MLRRLSVSTALWLVLVALLSTGTASAQDDSTDDDEAVVQSPSYGDTELIEALRAYGLLDEWIAASPVSPQASLLLVTGNGGYQTQRRTFLNALDAWADRTERIRNDLARIDAAQANADRLRAIVTQVRDALVRDDRLASDSKTLLQIQDALGRLAGVAITERSTDESQDSLAVAEMQLNDLRERAETEIVALNGMAPALATTGVDAFVGFDELQVGLDNVNQLVNRARESARPAREESERLASSAVAQIPSLHASRMLGSSDVAGLSVVTVDAYIRAAAQSPCSVDWALLAGIGKIESNHGRIGGATVSRSGQVSTSILGPLLDGGATGRENEAARLGGWTAITEEVEVRLAAHGVFGNALSGVLRRVADRRPSGLADVDRGVNVRDDSDDTSGAIDVDEESGDQGNGDQGNGDQGNGFAVVFDSDGGQLDGNDQWDRAIGPMQFIPETWSKWATDGNGDGVADPHNLYDAAAAAGRFLCDLSATRGSSPSSFVLGYNSSASYVRSVLSTAQAFRGTSLPES